MSSTLYVFPELYISQYKNIYIEIMHGAPKSQTELYFVLDQRSGSFTLNHKPMRCYHFHYNPLRRHLETECLRTITVDKNSQPVCCSDKLLNTNS